MMRSERGSITVFTLSVGLLMIFVLVGIFMGNQNKIINQKKQLRAIENSYNNPNEVEEMARIYEETLEKDINNIEADLKITTAEELKDFATRVNGGETFEGKTVALMNDIDMSSVCSESLGSWTPIGDNSTTTFRGTFNARKYTISNLYIETTENNQGLFGYNSGIIKNLILSSGTVKSQSLYIAGIVARNYGTIDSCKCQNFTIINTVASTSEHNIGGIVARNDKSYSVIKNCSSVSNTITNVGKGHTGGIAGLNYGTIESSYNTSTVQNTNTSANGTGGIVGYSDGTVSKCYNEGTIDGKDNVGGIAGNTNTSGNVELCYNKGIVRNSDTAAASGENAGGVIGWNRGILSNSYNVGTVTNLNTNTNVYTGGVVALNNNNATVKNSYNIGEIIPSGGKIGAIVGRNYSTSAIMTNCYAITSTLKNGVLYEEGTANSKTNIIADETFKTYTDILNENGVNSYWKVDSSDINSGYPILSWQ